MSVRMIRPCVLVAVRSTVRGGVQYLKEDISASIEGQRARSKWLTEKIVENKAEFERANKVRNKAMSEIRRPCSKTSFGLVCPLNREGELDEATDEAKRLISEFNAEAEFSQINISLVKGQVASTDQEAMAAVRDEVSELLEAMNEGISSLDPKAIREAAKKAKDVASVLDDGAAKRVTAAIEAARGAARVIVRKVEKAGEDAEKVLSELNLADLKTARFSFLDHGEGEEVDFDLPASSMQRFANAGDDADSNVQVPDQSNWTGKIDMEVEAFESVAAVNVVRKIDMPEMSKREQLIAGREVISEAGKFVVVRNDDGSESVVTVPEDSDAL